MGTVLAAGGVLWRPGAHGGVEVAVVHRPRYDDWSLPKGKLHAGEHPLLGALREVREETGFAAVAGRGLGVSAYRVLLHGREVPKTVRWWALRTADGSFAASDEVDELRWLAPPAALALLTAGRDAAPLQLLVAAGLDTTTVLLVRHAHAGDRHGWRGDDARRPLDDRGCRQAAALAALLPAWAPTSVVSAPVVRCTSTVEPAARSAGLPVAQEAVFGEAAGDPAAALSRLRELAAPGGCVVVCSQGSVVPELVRGLAAEAGLDVGEVTARKGSVWALTLQEGRLVDADLTAPLS